MSQTNEETLSLAVKLSNEKLEKFKEVISRGEQPSYKGDKEKRDEKDKRRSIYSETLIKEETPLKKEIRLYNEVLPPTNFRVTGKGTNYFDLAWEEPNNGKCSTQYHILYQEIGARKLDWIPCHVVIGTRHRLGGLRESTKYMIAIYSVCDGVLSEECKLLFDETKTSFMKSVLTFVGVGATVLSVGTAVFAA